MTEFDMTFKILMLGNASVGKTTLAERYITGIFNPDLKLTVGVEFFIKTVEIQGKRIKLQIWDMGGEERFRFLLPTYCLGTSGAIFLYDITNKASLEAHPAWLSIVREKNGNIPILLAGNKIDLEDEREVSTEMGIDVAKKSGMAGFVEVSAKTGINVEKTFSVLTDLMIKYAENPAAFESLSTKDETEINKPIFAPSIDLNEQKMEENKKRDKKKGKKIAKKKFKKIKFWKK
ncbi:MAG: Rab family GTPase [Promethearchaeota archaeon]